MGAGTDKKGEDKGGDDEQRRFVRRVLIVLGLLALFAVTLTLMGLAWTATLTLFGGALIGVLIDGVASKISSWTKMPRRVAVVLVCVLTLGAMVGAGFWIGPNLVEQAQGLREQLSSAWQDVHGWLETHAWGQKILGELNKLEFGTLLSGSFGGMLSTAAGSVTSLILMVVFGIYFAFDPEVYVNGFARLFPLRHRDRVHELAGSVGLALRSWLVGRFSSMAVVGVGTTIGLWIAGVPLALPLGILAGLFSFVPNLGPLLSALPGILMGFTVDWQTALWAVLVYSSVQALENYAITPLIQQHVVSMPPALLIGFQMLMGLSAGVIGLFMATPLLVTIVVLVQAVYLREVLDDDIKLIGEKDEGDEDHEDHEDHEGEPAELNPAQQQVAEYLTPPTRSSR